jgi:hypothetical protein
VLVSSKEQVREISGGKGRTHRRRIGEISLLISNAGDGRFLAAPDGKNLPVLASIDLLKKVESDDPIRAGD